MPPSEKQACLRELRTIPGVGKRIAEDFWEIGICTVRDLVGRDPIELYEKLNLVKGYRVDRCMLYTFRCAVYYASNEAHDAKLLKWWNWKDRQDSTRTAKKSSETAKKSNAILKELKSLSNIESVAGMARYGINPTTAYGVSIPDLRAIARRTGTSHDLAHLLWESGIHEARILASMIEDPGSLTEDQMDRWAKDFNSWDLCDQCCNNLFRKVSRAYDKALAWTSRNEEFVKRAGFVLAACLAVHDKKATDEQFIRFLPVIEREAADTRNFVKKAVNWALRQIGKRNPDLNVRALEYAYRIREMDSKSAKWVAADAIRELADEKVRRRLGSIPEKYDALEAARELGS